LLVNATTTIFDAEEGCFGLALRLGWGASRLEADSPLPGVGPE
jgi:hypothetical protein